MKKSVFTIMALIFSSLTAFAGEPIIHGFNSELTTKAFEILIAKADVVKLKGEVSPDDKLKKDFDEVGEFLAEHLFAGLAGDDSDYQGPISKFDAKCTQSPGMPGARCELDITYKVGTKNIMFYVVLNNNNIPKYILGNSVYITRGD